MFKLNLKIALRNLFKNKVYAAINIGGLALGLSAFVLLLLYINHEESYDTWDKELQNVYQLRENHDFFTPDNKKHWQELVNSRMAGLAKEKIPQIKAVTKVSQTASFSDGYSVKIDRKDPVLIKDINDADSNFFKVLPYKFLQGNPEKALQAPNSVVLKQSFANKLFGTDKVLGKTFKLLMWRADEGSTLTVTGVVADPETPESVNFNAIMRTGRMDKEPDPGNTNYCQIYARFSGLVDTVTTNKAFQKVYVDFKKVALAAGKKTAEEGNQPGLKVIPVKEVHGNIPFEINWLDKLKPVIGISIFLLLVSVINFINLATAQSMQRAKEVGVKKVLGSYKKQLISQFLMESGLQSLLSLFLSIALIEILLPAFNRQFGVELSFWHNPQLLGVVFQLLALFLFVTLLAGFYPAWILSRFNPVAVLKGNYENSLKGVALRNVLVVFQFVISITFIIAIGIMHQQSKYMSNKDLGFDRGHLINIKTNYEEDFAERIKRIPGVQYVATTTQVLGNAFNSQRTINYKGNQIDVNSVTVTMEALPALGVKVMEGRIFSPEYKQDSVNTVVVNQAAAKLFGNKVIGQQFTQSDGKYTFQIVGVIKDYHNEGFDKEVLPTIYKVTQLGGTSNTNNLLIRFNTDKSREIINKIGIEWKKLYPDYPMQYTSMEDTFNEVLESNERFINMIVLFSLVSVSLSLLGLFALSTFIAKRRTKEIAVRKVLGASNLQIVSLLNRSFLILVVVANLAAWPIAYIIIQKWLKGFAYRIDMPVFPFLLATLASVLIATLTVSIQARKAAVSDPVNALKYE